MSEESHYIWQNCSYGLVGNIVSFPSKEEAEADLAREILKSASHADIMTFRVRPEIVEHKEFDTPVQYRGYARWSVGVFEEKDEPVPYVVTFSQIDAGLAQMGKK